MVDFDADSHTYWKDGVTIPAVSDILKKTLPDPYSFVDEQTLATARERGIAVDAAITTLLTTGHPIVTAEVMPYLASYSEWVNATGWRSLTTQPQLYDADLDIAGTADEVGILNGQACIIDWKCTAQALERNKYQLAGYARAWDAMHPEWQLKQGRLLQLHGDGRCATAIPVDLKWYGIHWLRLVRQYRAVTAAPAPMGE